MEKTRRIRLNLGECKRCEACSDMAGKFVQWDTDNDMPVLVEADVPEELARELVMYCPDDCFEFEDEE